MKIIVKALAAIILMTTLVFAVGCTPEDDTLGADPYNISGTYNGHDYVDLGLPSGTLWATCNVGTDSIEGKGHYYAWGETQPKDTLICDWSTYKYCMGSDTALTKYCGDTLFGHNNFTDNLTILSMEDDVAWGSLHDTIWRMPTIEEWQELYANTTVKWIILHNVKGLLFIATNGNGLFLPAAGYRGGDNSYDEGRYGDYWSSSLYEESPCYAWGISFRSDYFYQGGYSRSFGQSVRPVLQCAVPQDILN